jgi:NAD(P)H-hydrate epimerase
MIAGYSAAQIRAAEAPLIAAGVPLMQRAAAGLAAHIRELRPPPARVLLLVGSGDNGGDALHAGAELATDGYRVSILPTGTRMHEAGLARAQASGAEVVEQPPDPGATDADIIVDGILGTGTSSDPALRGRALDIVTALLPLVNGDRAPLVVAVDLPSGIHPDTGAANGPVLPADLTVTFGGHKAGLVLDPGRTLAGRVQLIDIGLDLTGIEPLIRVND